MTQEKRLSSPYGFVFNIQHYSVHDGPGIRTLVFLKGCPLHCAWCSNPESQRLEPELAYNPGKCIGTKECGLCIEGCPGRALSEDENGLVRIDRASCQKCFACADVCPAQALTVFGKLMTVEEVIATVEADEAFYGRSGGGMTLSGGEPLAQAGFAIELLKEARRRRINTSMETCGFAEWKDLEEACRYLDNIMFDIKHMDPVKHQKFTGVSNERILENFTRLCQEFPNLPKLVRTPVIPGFNDTEEEIAAIIDFIKDKPSTEYELLAFHRFGQPKYGYLGREYELADAALDSECMKTLQQLKQASMENQQQACGCGNASEPMQTVCETE